MTKVLHILDLAGISSIISHYYNFYKKGKSDLMYHQKSNVSSNISSFYEGIPFLKFQKLLWNSLLKSKNYDIIHIHGAEILVPLYKLTGKKIVLHYHGSDINEKTRSESKKRIICRSMADLILFNGKNMLTKIITKKNVDKKYLPNPIDTEHFSINEKKDFDALSFVSNNLNKKKTCEAINSICQTNIIDLDLQQIPYRIMPRYITKYRNYIDIKIMPWGDKLSDLSTIALQALACGCKVYHNKEWLNEFPEEHHPKKVIELLDEYYYQLLNK